MLLREIDKEVLKLLKERQNELILNEDSMQHELFALTHELTTLLRNINSAIVLSYGKVGWDKTVFEVERYKPALINEVAKEMRGVQIVFDNNGTRYDTEMDTLVFDANQQVGDIIEVNNDVKEKFLDKVYLINKFSFAKRYGGVVSAQDQILINKYSMKGEDFDNISSEDK